MIQTFYTNNKKTIKNGGLITIGSKEVYNNIRLKNIKRAKLRQKEAELNLYINKGYDDKMITQTMKDISKLKVELNQL